MNSPNLSWVEVDGTLYRFIDFIRPILEPVHRRKFVHNTLSASRPWCSLESRSWFTDAGAPSAGRSKAEAVQDWVWAGSAPLSALLISMKQTWRHATWDRKIEPDVLSMTTVNPTITISGSIGPFGRGRIEDTFKLLLMDSQLSPALSIRFRDIDANSVSTFPQKNHHQSLALPPPHLFDRILILQIAIPSPRLIRNVRSRLLELRSLVWKA